VPKAYRQTIEASELLSVLSKLEDRIVHRAEPSKPGRFARAVRPWSMPIVPASPRSANRETGWEKRIAFPSKKSKSEKEDDTETYDSVKPDLRDVIEKAEKQREEASKPAEDRLQVAAMAPADLPKDITPEELAALAAAAAQVQARLAAADLEKANSEADKTAISDGVAKTVAKTEEESEAVEEAKSSRRTGANWDAPSPAPPEEHVDEAESSPESAGATFAGGANEEIADAAPPTRDEYRKDSLPAVAAATPRYRRHRRSRTGEWQAMGHGEFNPRNGESRRGSSPRSRNGGGIDYRDRAAVDRGAGCDQCRMKRHFRSSTRCTRLMQPSQPPTPGTQP